MHFHYPVLLGLAKLLLPVDKVRELFVKCKFASNLILELDHQHFHVKCNVVEPPILCSSIVLLSSTLDHEVALESKREVLLFILRQVLFVLKQLMEPVIAVSKVRKLLEVNLSFNLSKVS